MVAPNLTSGEGISPGTVGASGCSPQAQAQAQGTERFQTGWPKSACTQVRLQQDEGQSQCQPDCSSSTQLRLSPPSGWGATISWSLGGSHGHVPGHGHPTHQVHKPCGCSFVGKSSVTQHNLSAKCSARAPLLSCPPRSPARRSSRRSGTSEQPASHTRV